MIYSGCRPPSHILFLKEMHSEPHVHLSITAHQISRAHGLRKQKDPVRENVLRNKIWYRGDSAELEQYFQKTARWDVEKARFWAAHAQGNVRKMHSGIVGTVVDRYKDIVLADMDSIDFGENQKSLNELWDKLYEKSKLNDVIGEAITGALAAGDGAFKITADSCSEYPIVEFYDAENVDYVYVHSKLQEIKFYTTYKNGKKDLRLEETYGHGYIKYKLYDDYGKEVPLNQFGSLCASSTINAR